MTYPTPTNQKILRKRGCVRAPGLSGSTWRQDKPEKQILSARLHHQTRGTDIVGPYVVGGFVKAFTFTSRNLARPQASPVDEELDRMDWRHRAACRDEDPELFFPIGNTGPALLQIEEAKAVCRRCPEMEACLQWALESGQDAGVWGGMSEDERRALKRRAARNRARASA
ncbi:hypothetical protein GCM10023205_08700 [Yinghuangia aomiensis]